MPARARRQPVLGGTCPAWSLRALRVFSFGEAVGSAAAQKANAWTTSTRIVALRRPSNLFKLTFDTFANRETTVEASSVSAIETASAIGSFHSGGRQLLLYPVAGDRDDAGTDAAPVPPTEGPAPQRLPHWRANRRCPRPAVGENERGKPRKTSRHRRLRPVKACARRSAREIL